MAAKPAYDNRNYRFRVDRSLNSAYVFEQGGGRKGVLDLITALVLTIL